MNTTLLSDDQIREFITNGFLILNCENQELLHKVIKDKLEYLYHTESWLGNNVMARVPELWSIVGSSIVIKHKVDTDSYGNARFKNFSYDFVYTQSAINIFNSICHKMNQDFVTSNNYLFQL